jgi:hypothetical protein
VNAFVNTDPCFIARRDIAAEFLPLDLEWRQLLRALQLPWSA